MHDKEKILLQNLSGKKSGRIPLWLMRQAGRYLPEYRELRAKKGGFLEMAFDPQAACEVTMQPIRRFGMDGAIIFSDILTIPYGLGQHLEFVTGEGPKLEPIKMESDSKKLSFEKFDEILEPVYEALRQTKSALMQEGYAGTTLIGFAGAPWTVMTYMIEGGSSRNFIEVKKMMYAQPALFESLMNLVVEATSRYLIKQVDAGADALKIFDSWASSLDAESFQRWAVEPVQKIILAVKEKHPSIPIIGFPKGAGYNYISYAKKTDIDALALDPQVPLDWACDELQTLKPVQGNLDPICLYAGGKMMEKRIYKILETFANGPFIFNLGHGIYKETPISHVEQLVKMIRDYA